VRPARRGVVPGRGETGTRALATLLSAYPSGTVVVVSHVSPIKLILRDALAAG
jgi:probable phosphoglycerate mutase